MPKGGGTAHIKVGGLKVIQCNSMERLLGYSRIKIQLFLDPSRCSSSMVLDVKEKSVLVFKEYLFQAVDAVYFSKREIPALSACGALTVLDKAFVYSFHFIEPFCRNSNCIKVFMMGVRMP